MSESKSLDQMHQECCQELQRLAPDRRHGGSAISRADGSWLLLLGPVVGVGWSLIGILITYFTFQRPVQQKLKELQDALDRALVEDRKRQAADPGPEALRLIAELKAILEQALPELRGKVPPRLLDDASQQITAHLLAKGVPEAQAEEAAAVVTDTVGRPLLAPPGEGTPPAGAPS
jgi:hypothetical protein